MKDETSDKMCEAIILMVKCFGKRLHHFNKVIGHLLLMYDHYIPEKLMMALAS